MGASASALLYKISWSPGYGTVPGQLRTVSYWRQHQ
jgi:hypothetical protein